MAVSTSNGRAALGPTEAGSVSIIEGNAAPVTSCHRSRRRRGQQRHCRKRRGEAQSVEKAPATQAERGTGRG